MTDKISPVCKISICSVGTPIQILAAKISNYFVACDAEQRPYEPDAPGKFFHWPDAAQAAKTCSANHSVNNCFGVIVFMMSGGNTCTVLFLCNLNKIFDSQVSRAVSIDSFDFLAYSRTLIFPVVTGMFSFRHCPTTKSSSFAPHRLSTDG